MSADSLGSRGLAIVEVALNEAATKDQNPHVPYGTEEVVGDSIECADRGATAVHFHARFDDGSQAAGDADASEAVVGALAEARPDLVVWPTQLYDSLARRRTAFAPLEVPRLCFQEKWDPRRASFGPPATPASLGTNPGDFHMQSAPSPEEFRRLGAVGSGAIHGLGDVRWVAAAQASGRLSRPFCVKLFFSETALFMNAPTRRVFDLLASELVGVDHEAVVVPYGMISAPSCTELLRWALSQGMGIRVGIGESPLAYPTQRNAELVTEAVALLHEYGLEPATPLDLRRRLGSDAPARG